MLINIIYIIKLHPFDTSLDSAIFFDIESPTDLDKGLSNTISSINDHYKEFN